MALVFKCSFLDNYIHSYQPMSWGLKKMDIWQQRVDKNQHRFLVTSGCLLSRKV